MKTRPLNRNNKLYLLRKELYAENSDKEDNFDDKLDYNEEMISDEHQVIIFAYFINKERNK